MRSSRAVTAVAAVIAAALTLTACSSDSGDEPIRTGEIPATPTPLSGDALGS